MRIYLKISGIETDIEPYRSEEVVHMRKANRNWTGETAVEEAEISSEGRQPRLR
jgi:hypothetical protein